MIDPNELERLSKAAEEARKLREGSQFEPGTDEWLAENNAIWFAEEVFLTALEAAYRTGQLVPAQPSGGVETCEDIVRGIAGDPCSCGVMHYAITCLPCRCKAAITAYEALRAKDTRP